MPFREKKAWATIFALIVVFFPYYFIMGRLYHQPEPSYIALGHLALLALVSFVVLEVIMVLVARKLSPEDAGIPSDERDQLFAYRASRVAYVTLISLMVVVTFLTIHTEGGNWGWGMLYLAAILFAEITRAAMLIIQYRRG